MKKNIKILKRGNTARLPSIFAPGKKGRINLLHHLTHQGMNGHQRLKSNITQRNATHGNVFHLLRA